MSTVSGPVGERRHVQLTWNGSGITAAWDPSPPSSLTKSEHRAYAALRRSLLQQVANQHRQPIAIVEIGDGGRPVTEVVHPSKGQRQ